MDLLQVPHSRIGVLKEKTKNNFFCFEKRGKRKTKQKMKKKNLIYETKHKMK
jgi:hypothetical protein